MKDLRLFGITGLLIIVVLATSCENDLKDVERISSAKTPVIIDKSYDVEVIISDSAVVKAKLITPELFHVKASEPYYEMGKGVTIIFYDAARKESGRVTSDYAIRRESQKLVEFKRNVVVTNAKGETLKSDEVTWDENKQLFSSDKRVTVVFADGSTWYGNGFWAKQDLVDYQLDQATGNFNVPEKEGF